MSLPAKSPRHASVGAGRVAQQRCAGRTPRAWVLLLTVVIVGLSVDLGSKWYAFRNVANAPVVLDSHRIASDRRYDPIPYHQPIVMVPGLFNARLVINHGAVFGLGEGKRYFFIIFTVAAVGIALIVFARWTKSHQMLAHVSIGLILAGGVGNLYDRWAYGVVRDFIHMFPEVNLPFGWEWPGGSPELFPWVFNIADVLLLSGMFLLLIHINRIEKDRDAETSEGGANADDADTPTRTRASRSTDAG